MWPKNIWKVIPLLLVSSFYPVFSTSANALNDSASAMANPAVRPMTLQPKTSDKSAETKKYVVSVKKADSFSCPSGYALTKVGQAPQKTKDVTVYGECNGGVVFAYAHVWCKNSPNTTKSVIESPQVTYTCQKIINAWTATG